MKKILWTLFFILLPFQTQWILRVGQLNGQSWEYGTIGIYATDLMLLILALLSLRGPRWPSGPVAIQKKLVTGCAAILVMAVLCSMTVAIDRSVALLHIFWVIEALLLAWIVAAHHDRTLLLNSFIAGSLVQALIGLTQFFSQTTIADTFLGMAAHPVWQPGTSVIELSGERWLRAYAGFPHPNMFGGWMAISILILLSQYSLSLSKGQRSSMSVVLIILSGGLAVSFSRSAEIALALGIAVMCATLPPRIGGSWRGVFSGTAIILLSAASILLPYHKLASTRVEATDRLEQESIIEREGQYGQAWELIRRQSLAGMGNYTAAVAQNHPNIPVWNIQPVHNVFVLMAAEIHWIGLLLFLIMLYYLLKNIFGKTLHPEHPFELALFVVWIVLMSLDHYLWSLHGGLLLSGVIIGVLATNPQS